MDVETIGYALLFAVPTGVGVAVGVLATTGARSVTPLAVAAGALTAAAVGALVLAATAVGSEDLPG